MNYKWTALKLNYLIMYLQIILKNITMNCIIIIMPQTMHTAKISPFSLVFIIRIQKYNINLI